jgi:hypothetical protein
MTTIRRPLLSTNWRPDTGPDAEGAGFLPATPTTAQAIAQADLLRILGFADLTAADVVEVIGSKGIFGQKQQATLTFTISSVVVGQEVTVDLEFRSDNNEGEFASHLSDYKRKKAFTLTVRAGETATSLASRLVSEINSIIDSGWAAWITATSSSGVVTLVSGKATVQFSASVHGSAITAGNVAGAFAVTVDGYGGRNTYDQLKGLRLDTVAGHYAESKLTDQVPLKGAKYSSYLIKKKVSRPDLAGFTHINDKPQGEFELQIFVNEANAAYISDLTSWLNANVAKRTMYGATTAAHALANPETNLSTQTVVDAAAPFSTNLV